MANKALMCSKSSGYIYPVLGESSLSFVCCALQDADPLKCTPEAARAAVRLCGASIGNHLTVSEQLGPLLTYSLAGILPSDTSEGGPGLGLLDAQRAAEALAGLHLLRCKSGAMVPFAVTGKENAASSVLLLQDALEAVIVADAGEIETDGDW